MVNTETPLLAQCWNHCWRNAGTIVGAMLGQRSLRSSHIPRNPEPRREPPNTGAHASTASGFSVAAGVPINNMLIV